LSQKSIVKIHESGKESHISATEALELIHSGNYSFAGRRDGKQVLTYQQHRVILWNGSCRDKNAMHGPGEVRS